MFNSNSNTTENSNTILPESTELFLLLQKLLLPSPQGYMHSGPILATMKLKELVLFIQSKADKLETLKNPGYAADINIYRLVTLILEYYGIKFCNKDTKFATYYFGMSILKIKGFFHIYAQRNIKGMKTIYNHVLLLNKQFLLYDELLPDMFTKVDEASNVLKPDTDPMLISMATCHYLTALTRIIVNFEKQIIEEGQAEHLQNSMEYIMGKIIEFLSGCSINKNEYTGLKNNLFEYLYRIEISHSIFTGLEDQVSKVITLISPIDRAKQQGRTALRVGVIACEMDFRDVLLALRSYQFQVVVNLCDKIMDRLQKNQFFTSNHEGTGALCFIGFSMNFVRLANEALDLFEELNLWEFSSAIHAGEMIAKVLINFFNLPNKKNWDGHWYKTHLRNIEFINKMASLKGSETYCHLFGKSFN